jgi:hypothetical protein
MGDDDQEDGSLKSALAKNSLDPISTNKPEMGYASVVPAMQEA